jgi:magnesium-transporting ATPase (P-type)
MIEKKSDDVKDDVEKWSYEGIKVIMVNGDKNINEKEIEKYVGII